MTPSLENNRTTMSTQLQPQIARNTVEGELKGMSPSSFTQFQPVTHPATFKAS
jgi:hypothetical protein